MKLNSKLPKIFPRLSSYTFQKQPPPPSIVSTFDLKPSRNRWIWQKNTDVEYVVTSKRGVGRTLIDWAVTSQHCNLFGVVSKSGVHSREKKKRERKRERGIRRNKERKDGKRKGKKVAGWWMKLCTSVPGGPKIQVRRLVYRDEHSILPHPPLPSLFFFLFFISTPFRAPSPDQRFLESLPGHETILLRL